MKKTTTTKKTTLARSPKSEKKHSQQFLKVYWPYIPLFILVFFGLIFGMGLPGTSTQYRSTGVLAYATEMSTNSLLNATNAQRAQNGGLPALTYNSKLAAAAQAKANDMVARNYWSHNTPDGKEPWVFFDAAGYDYQKAGENLAYGFASSADTVTGWMNSPSHRANILDTSFKEVGFGFANASDYVTTGNETVVVAEYGNPAESVVTVVVPTAAAPAAKPKVQSAAAQASTPTTQNTVVDDTLKATPATLKPLPADRVNQAINSDNPVPASQPSTNITKLQTITGGIAPWSALALSVTTIAVTVLWALKHALIVKRAMIDGEQFLLHHPVVDVGVMSIVAFAILMSQSSGVVK